MLAHGQIDKKDSLTKVDAVTSNSQQRKPTTVLPKAQSTTPKCDEVCQLTCSKNKNKNKLIP